MATEPSSSLELCAKIARLVEERGWNIEEFARQAKLHRLTVRHIMLGSGRRLHNSTIAACARALGLSVAELRTEPLPHLLTRMRPAGETADLTRRLYEEAMQPELKAWMQRNPERAAQLTAEEIDELLSLQGTGGPLTAFGVAHYVELLERRRKLIEQVIVVAGTEYLDLLERFVAVLYDKVQPYRSRGLTGAGDAGTVAPPTPGEPTGKATGNGRDV
ncbi:MAG: helix-turn-helix transcriptional regulator [Gemmataceae bacterium]|nr:helix-turn-helix transcriptional regulator [Gemmataceae bacterium]